MPSELIGTLFSAGMAAYGQERANVQNTARMREQMSWQEKMMDKQNAYNTPAMQMQRFKDAGLNPNLIYGQMSPQASAGVQGVAPAQMENSFGDASHIASQIPSLMMQSRLTQSQVALQDAEAKNLNADATGKELDNDLKRKELGDWANKRAKYYEQIDAMIKETNQNIAESTARELNFYSLSHVNEETWKKIRLERETYEEMKDDIIYNLELQNAKLFSSIWLDYENIEYISELALTQVVLRGLYASEIGLNNAKIATEGMQQIYLSNLSWESVVKAANILAKTPDEVRKLAKEIDVMNQDINTSKALEEKYKEEGISEKELRRAKKYMLYSIAVKNGVDAFDVWFGTPNTKRNQMLNLAGRKQKAGKR